MSSFEIPPPLQQFDATMDDGAVIRIRRHGTPGGLRVVLSHGNGFAVDAYFPFWRLLLDDCDVMVFDLRNYGQNPPHDPEAHSYPRIIADLPLIRDAIVAECGPALTVGAFHSLSARANMKFAVDHGSLWDALVLFDPPLAPPRGHSLYQAAVDDSEQLARAGARRRERFRDPSDLATLFAKAPLFRGWVPGAHALAARAVLRRDARAGNWVLSCPVALEAQIYRGTVDYGTWPPRSAFDRPVMLVCGDPGLPDAGCPALCGKALHDEMGIDYAFVPGTRHFLQLEQPEACRRIMVDFLAANGLSATGQRSPGT